MSSNSRVSEATVEAGLGNGSSNSLLGGLGVGVEVQIKVGVNRCLTSCRLGATSVTGDSIYKII